MAFDNYFQGFADSNDVLGQTDGAPTADRLAGGTGDDTYYVDSRDDRVVEDYGGGDNDLVIATVTYHLGNNLENLTLAGNDKIGGWGNEGDNIINGNSASNTLVGGGGDDTINGGGGNDRIYGGTGNDTLTGGTGRDLFIFDTRLDANTNVDTITDFTVGEDKIGLNSVPFFKFSTELRDNQFTTDDPAARTPTIIYDRETGNLSYDSDGTGSAKAVLFAHLTPNLDLTADDFVIIA